MKIVAKNMLVLADHTGKILAAYIPDGKSGTDSPQIALAASEQHSVHECEIPSELINARFDAAVLRRYRVLTEGGRSKLILHDPIEKA